MTLAHTVTKPAEDAVCSLHAVQWQANKACHESDIDTMASRPGPAARSFTPSVHKVDVTILDVTIYYLRCYYLRCYYLRCYYQHVSTCLKLLLSACINMYQHVLNFRFELTFWGSAASPLQTSARCVRASECASKGSSASKCICWLHLGPT